VVSIVNFRGVPELGPPAGYYGNACVPVAAVTTVGVLLDGTLGDAVALVRETKAASHGTLPAPYCGCTRWDSTWVPWVRRVGRSDPGGKKLTFWQKRSPNCDFLVLRSPSTLSTSKNI
jgi:hypothetical protein